MSDDKKTYIVAAPRINVVTGTNPRTGNDRTRPYSRGQEVQLDAEQADRQLRLGGVREKDGKTEDEARAAEQEQAAAEQLTEKQALVKQAEELGLETKGTVIQLKARIAEEQEKRADGPADGTGGEDPDKE